MNPRLIRTWFVPPTYLAWVPWPNTILYREPFGAWELAHELGHVLQWQRLGWRFPFVYVWGMVRSRFSHAAHPLEVEAEQRIHDLLPLAQQILREANLS
jgi:hypothetical protein